MKIEKANINELISPDWNPRQITEEELKKLETSLNEFGYIEPIIVNDVNNHIVGGNQRCKALKTLGYDEVDVVYVHIEDLAKEKACNVDLNKISGDWDNDKLKIVLEEIELSPVDVSLTGFDEIELTEMGIKEPTETNEETSYFDVEEDNYQDENITVTVEDGDLYQLGNHRLYCGDATKQESYPILTNKKEMDLVFTDPPYGMKKEKDGILNDNLNYDNLLEFNKKWIPLTFKALKENGSWYCWGIDEPLMDIYSNILKPMQKENKITFRNLLTWDKGDAGAGGVSFMGKDGLRSYPIGSEKCLFVMCGVQGFNNNQDNYFEGWEPIRQYLVGEAEKVGLTPQKLKEICGVGMWSHWFGKSQFAFITEEHYRELQEYYSNDAFKKEYDELKKEYYSTRAYFDNTHDKMRDVWDLGRISHDEKMQAGRHATPKPIALCSRAIKTSSRENEKVLDVFGGSGSTLIACEQLNRTCYTMELDPYYCQVIINRWEHLTGEKATKIN